jgi:hypothetical protein
MTVKSQGYGLRGPKGDTGAAGAAGVKGDTGATGSQGAPGAQGLQGAKGDTGSQGPQGVQGVKGDTGAAGASFALAAPVVTVLSLGEKNGTAFQPRAGGPCMVNITASISGLASAATVITAATSPTLNGTYTPVAVFALSIVALGVTMGDGATGTFPVPTGHYVKITQTGVTILANVNMNRIVWAL